MVYLVPIETYVGGEQGWDTDWVRPWKATPSQIRSYMSALPLGVREARYMMVQLRRKEA